MSIARDISRQSKKQIVNISSNTSNIDVDGGFSGSTLDVYLNGSKLIQNADYALNGNSGIILSQAGVAGDVIEFVIKTTPNILSIVDTSALVDEAVTFSKLSNSATEADNAQKRTAKAWVNFNGTGTVAIRASFNVSSVTDLGVGKYRINFTNSFSDGNYSVTTGLTGVNVSTDIFLDLRELLTTYVNIFSWASNIASNADTSLICVAIFR